MKKQEGFETKICSLNFVPKGRMKLHWQNVVWGCSGANSIVINNWVISWSIIEFLIGMQYSEEKYEGMVGVKQWLTSIILNRWTQKQDNKDYCENRRYDCGLKRWKKLESTYQANDVVEGNVNLRIELRLEK